MNRFFNNRYRLFTVLSTSVLLLYACTKDKVPLPEPPPEPTNWEVISGDYKVYDTNGAYLYDMSIAHEFNPALNNDSLHFTNFDGQFNFSAAQSTPGSNPEYYLSIGFHNLLYDTLSNRWKIFEQFDEIYNYVLKNDTLLMYFRKTNITYYLSDFVPYYECYCKQVAVKQQ